MMYTVTKIHKKLNTFNNELRSSLKWKLSPKLHMELDNLVYTMVIEELDFELFHAIKNRI